MKRILTVRNHDFRLQCSDFVLKCSDFVLNIFDFVLKMFDFAGEILKRVKGAIGNDNKSMNVSTENAERMENSP